MANEPTTQQLVDISDIRDDIVVLKNGSLRTVIEVSAINFELRSEDEQMALIQNFQRFLNSLDFQAQIVIQSRKMDIGEYLKYIDEQMGQLDELLKIQASEYSRFVRELSGLANIMSKKFYIVIPFFIYENPKVTGVRQSLLGLMKPAKTVANITEEQLSTYRNQLLQRAELVYSGLVGLGLKTRVIEGEDLIRIIYGFYNPGSNLGPLSTEQDQNGK